MQNYRPRVTGASGESIIKIFFFFLHRHSSVQFSRSVVSDSL